MDRGSSLELKIMHCKDLKAFNFFQKLLVYVLVSIIRDDDVDDGDNGPDVKLDKHGPQRTPTDADGDGNPEWNHEMRFDLSEVLLQNRDRLFVHFDLRHEGLYFGDKVLGEVRVPLNDLVQETSRIVRFMSYQVRSPDGKPNGVLRFSCKANGVDSPKPEITGYPVIDSPLAPQISSPQSLYPSIESEVNIHQIFPTPQDQTVQYPSITPQCPSSNEDYYPPPYPYYPPPPPPPPPIIEHAPPPPPPPIVGHGACCHPPRQTSQHPWTIGGYDYTTHGDWSLSPGQPHTFGYPHDFGGGRDTYPAPWNGR